MRRVKGMQWALLGAGLLFGLSASFAGQDVAEDGWKDLVSNDGTYRLRWKSDPASFEFGDRFRVQVEASRTDGEPLQATLALDARMPEHGHGMNREPKIKSLGDGRFEVDGLLFHMPGYWEIYFDLTRGAITERTQVSLDID